MTVNAPEKPEDAPEDYSWVKITVTWDNRPRWLVDHEFLRDLIDHPFRYGTFDVS